MLNILFIWVSILQTWKAKLFYHFCTKFINSGHSDTYHSVSKKTDCSAEGKTIHILLLIPKRHTTYVTFKILVIIIRKFVKLKKWRIILKINFLMAMPPSLNLHACFTPTGPSAISGPNEDKDTYSVGKFFKFIHN